MPPTNFARYGNPDQDNHATRCQDTWTTVPSAPEEMLMPPTNYVHGNVSNPGKTSKDQL